MDNVVINIIENPVTVTVNVTEGAAPGTSTQNVFVQKTQPVASGNFIWFELNEDNTLKTIWINT